MMRQLGLSFLVLVTFGSTAFAAQVAKVKGRNVLISLQGEPAAVGDLYYAVSGTSKKAKLKIVIHFK